MYRGLVINGNAVQVHVEVNPRAKKTVSIEIKSKNKIMVKVPKGRDVDVDLLLEKYMPQIEKKYQGYISLKPVSDNGLILFYGEPRSIQIVQGTDNKVTLDENSIRIEHRQDSDPSRLLKRWVTEQTKNLISETIEKHPQLEKPFRFTVTDTRRWGYTRKGGVIVFNWQLSTLPKKLAEYVIIHELIHLKYPNHLNGFYNELTKIIPNYKERIEQIKQYLPIEKGHNLV